MDRQRNPQHSSVSRILSILLTLLPVLILLTSFVLAAVSSASKEWAYRSYFNNDDQMTLVGTQYRSLFVSCSLDQIITPDSTTNSTAAVQKRSKILSGWHESCPRVRSPKGLCDDASTTKLPGSGTLLCHHMSLAAKLVYAGCAMTAAALLLVLILTAISLPQVLRSGSVQSTALSRTRKGNRHRQHREHHRYIQPANHSFTAYAALLLRLLASLGGLALFMGMIVGTMALIVLHYPNGSFLTNSLGPIPTRENHAGPWLVGRAVGWCGAAAVLAWVGSYATGMVWLGPHVGVIEEIHHDNGNVHEAKNETRGGNERQGNLAEERAVDPAN
jgi:hypothetical protein